MDETTQYISDSIHTWVWSGFYSPSEVDSMIDDILEEGADEAFLRKSVAVEFTKKQQAEREWPARTDCDRLDEAFRALGAVGVLALHNAGYTMSDGHSDACEAIGHKGRERYFGYCFYHGQDVERAVWGKGLMIAFDHIEGDVPDKGKVGRIVVAELERAGFTCVWNGNTGTRISIPIFDWKRRGQEMPPKPQVSAGRWSLNLYVFVGFVVLGAACGAVGIIKKAEIRPSTVKHFTIVYFAAVCLVMSAVEIYTGEIRNTVNGPPLVSRTDSPRRFWSRIIVQSAVGIALLALLFLPE